MLLETTSTRDLFGLVLFCEVAESANGGPDQHVLTDTIRAALLSVCEACQHILRLALTRFESVDRLGCQQGNWLVSLRCQQHFDAPSSVFHSTKFTGDKHMGQNLPMQYADMFVV